LHTRAPSAPEPSSATIAVAAPAHGLPFSAWVMIYAFTGFIALGLEIAWFRLLGVLLKSTAFTFGTLLSIYLAGLGLGAAVGAYRVARSRRPGATFLLLQYGVALYVALSITALSATIAAGHPVKLVRFLGSYEPVNVYETLSRIRALGWSTPEALGMLADFVVLYLVVPALLIGPPTFLMGVSFAYVQKASQLDFQRLGRRLGSLLGANIAGGVLGATVTAWLLLTTLGTAGTLKTLVALAALLAWPFARLTWPEDRRRRTYALAGAAALAMGAAVAMPTNEWLWARLHGTTPARVLLDEDGAGLSLLKFQHTAMSGAVEVYVNGLGQSWLPYGDVHTALGAVPAFIHPAPADAAIIGLGSGDTAFAIAGRADIQRLVSIEILGAQRRTLERLLQVRRYPGLAAVLTDPRIEHRTGDGRAYLAQSDRAFDIIEADALRPSSAYAGNLYSHEYFALMLRKLKPGGYAVTWAPTERVRQTFLRVFPYVLALQGEIYIGSNAPIVFDREAVLARAAASRAYYEAAGVDLEALLRPYLEAPRRFTPDDPRTRSELNTDMFPRDEFDLPFW
jgi:spermidine synthase